MAPHRVNIELDEELVRRARERSSMADASDSELVGKALAEWLAFAALERSPVTGLAPHEADKLAVDEVRAHRASHDAAA